MSNVTRRSVAKGAAWSVPAIAVASASPAMAASYAQVDCTKVPALSDTGLKSVSIASGTQTSYDKTSGHSDIGMGSFFSINAGMWQFSKPSQPNGATADYVTGYKLSFGSYVGITTVDGTKSRGTAPTGGVTTPQVIGAGLAMALATQTQVPYKLVAKKAYNFPAGISIPFCVDWLAGLSSTDVGNCCYFLNYTFTATPDVFGNYPDSPQVANGGNAYSVTTTAQYGN